MNKERRGFSLLELMVCAVILALLMIGITGVLNIGNLSFPVDSAWIDLQQQTRQGMAAMIKELRQATTIPDAVFDSNQITFYRVDKPDIDITYYRNATNNRLIREEAGTPKILANYITYLRFQRPDTNPVFKIEIRAGQTVRQKALSFPLIEQVRLRNG